MATYTKHGTVGAEWDIDKNHDTWVLAKDATLTYPGIGQSQQFGIYENNDIAGSNIQVRGDITFDGFARWQVAMEIEGSGTEVHIYKTATVTATSGTGLESIADGAVILNEGKIVADTGIDVTDAEKLVNTGKIVSMTGIALSSTYDVENSGHISATETGVMLHGSGDGFSNREGGTIESDRYGIWITDAGKSHVVNDGVIGGALLSVQGNDGDTTLVNHGQLVGDVDLAGGNDVFDGRGGEVDGLVFGGSGDDVYKLSSPQMQIRELDNGGTDKVISMSGYTLGDYVENLTLAGKAAADGHGNTLANVIVGNKGANHLFGEAGQDVLSGGAGKDILFGGDDADTFLFRQHADTDIVRDFQDGSDHLSVDFIHTPDDLNELLANHMHQQGDSVVIAYGHDHLVIEHTMVTDLTADDFILK